MTVILILIIVLFCIAALPFILLLCEDLAMSFMESMRVLVEMIIEAWKELLHKWFKK